jgi:hypothetical protein
MVRLDLGAVGAVLDPSHPAVVTTAVAVQGLGCPTIWLRGGPLQDLDTVASIVRATSRAHSGTAIISVDRFPASDVDTLYAALEAEQPGQLIVGLGGAPGITTYGYRRRLPRPRHAGLHRSHPHRPRHPQRSRARRRTRVVARRRTIIVGTSRRPVDPQATVGHVKKRNAAACSGDDAALGHRGHDLL